MSKNHTALQTIIIHMSTNGNWHDFISYCQQLEAGLRKLAFKHLETFITNAKKWEIQRSTRVCYYRFLLF